MDKFIKGCGGVGGTHLLKKKQDSLPPWKLFHCCMIFSRLLKRAWACYAEINCCISIAIFSSSVASSFAYQFYFSKSHTPTLELYGDSFQGLQLPVQYYCLVLEY